jgi:hypothetical protein
MLQVECPAVQVLVAIRPNIAQFLEHTSCSAGRAGISVCRFAALAQHFSKKANGPKIFFLHSKKRGVLRV